MTDIVEKLRYADSPLCRDAAAEIIRLRAASRDAYLRGQESGVAHLRRTLALRCDAKAATWGNVARETKSLAAKGAELMAKAIAEEIREEPK